MNYMECVVKAKMIKKIVKIGKYPFDKTEFTDLKRVLSFNQISSVFESRELAEKELQNNLEYYEDKCLNTDESDSKESSSIQSSSSSENSSFDSSSVESSSEESSSSKEESSSISSSSTESSSEESSNISSSSENPPTGSSSTESSTEESPSNPGGGGSESGGGGGDDSEGSESLSENSSSSESDSSVSSLSSNSRSNSSSSSISSSSSSSSDIGYYGIFVADVYTKSHKESEEVVWTPDSYCSKSFSVFVYNVTNNVIDLNDIMYSYGENFVLVWKDADPDGLVGEATNDLVSYCAEYNEDGTCKQYNMTQYKIKIYRIGPYFEDYNQFAQYFYTGCNVFPDSNGKYPDIFRLYNNKLTMTNNASSCIRNYWFDYAEKLYNPNLTITFNIYNFTYNMYPYSAKYEMTEHCTYYCEGADCLQYGDNGCIECGEGGTLKESCTTYPDHQLYDAILLTSRHYEGEEIYYKIGGSASWKDDCGYGTGCWQYNAPTCCEYWSGSRNALSQLNEYDSNGTAALENYRLITDNSGDIKLPTSSNSLCFSKTYEAYHGDYFGDHYWREVQYGKMILARSENTPENASGVECFITAYTYKTNDDNSIIKDEYNYLYKNEFATFKFDTEYNFPLVNNCKQYYISNEEDCDGNCNYGSRPDYQPKGWHNQTETFTISLSVIRYV